MSGVQPGGAQINPFGIAAGVAAAGGQFDSDPRKKQAAIAAFQKSYNPAQLSLLNPAQRAQITDTSAKLGLGNNQNKKSVLNQVPTNQSRTQEGNWYVNNKTLLGQ